MNLLKQWLKKYRRWQAPTATVRRAVQRVLIETVGFTTEAENIIVAGRRVYLNLSGTRKSEVFMARSQLLEKLRSLLGNQAPEEII